MSPLRVYGHVGLKIYFGDRWEEYNKLNRDVTEERNLASTITAKKKKASMRLYINIPQHKDH
jgi:hypothetical protein